MNLPFNAANIDVQQVMSLAKDGSPMLVSAVGRAFGLGPSEQTAVANGKIPWWTWAAIGLVVGFTAGARIERRHRGKLPSIVAGRSV